jgi:transposase-like protein
MVQVKDLTELSIEDLWKEVKDEEGWWGDIQGWMLREVQRFLETAMDGEMLEHVRAAHYKRTEVRRGHRNGYRERSLLTQYGLITCLRVPRDREGTFQPTVIERYQRRQEQVNRLVRELFLRGVSTRQVQRIVELLLGDGVSAQTVSRITRTLDAEVRRFQHRPLADHYQYLFLDGVTLTVKGATGARKRLVLCAYGITTAGQRELLAFRQARSESEASWEAFLRDLYDRGLEGRTLRLITTDGCPGLHRALDTVYPYVRRQRCWAHKLRNVAAKLPRKSQEACLAGAKAIYEAPTRREAVQRYRVWAAQWRPVAPKAVACLEQDLEELLAFFACPRKHRRKVRTTNAIERAFREVRRRTRPMSCFQNEASVDRIIYGVISHLNLAWEAKPLREFTHNS